MEHSLCLVADIIRNEPEVDEASIPCCDTRSEQRDQYKDRNDNLLREPPGMVKDFSGDNVSECEYQYHHHGNCEHNVLDCRYNFHD